MLSTFQEVQSGEPLQLVLGTDKRNPLVSVYEGEETATLHVYYGLELMEVIPDQDKHPSYKLLVGRLYNAGVKVRVLCETFGVDRKTMKRWGDALLEGDPEKLVAVLTGRTGKITAEIESFVRMRFELVYREHPRDYSVRIRHEIKEMFDVTLSGEALRRLFGELRSRFHSAAPEPSGKKRETTCEIDLEGVSGETTHEPAVDEDLPASSGLRKTIS